MHNHTPLPKQISHIDTLARTHGHTHTHTHARIHGHSTTSSGGYGWSSCNIQTPFPSSTQTSNHPHDDISRSFSLSCPVFVRLLVSSARPATTLAQFLPLFTTLSRADMRQPRVCRRVSASWRGLARNQSIGQTIHVSIVLSSLLADICALFASFLSKGTCVDIVQWSSCRLLSIHIYIYDCQRKVFTRSHHQLTTEVKRFTNTWLAICQRKTFISRAKVKLRVTTSVTRDRRSAVSELDLPVVATEIDFFHLKPAD